MTCFQRSATALFLSCAIALPPAVAKADAPPPAPTAPTREEINPTPPTTEQPNSQAHVDERGAFAPGPCPLADSDVKLAITQVRFTAPGGGPLAPELARLLAGIGAGGGSQSVRVVCDYRDRANELLRQARYVASVQVPTQRIDDGVLRLEVVSGHITEVHVRGDGGPFEGIVNRRIDMLKKLDPLNANDAERLLLLANDTPGLNLQLRLAPQTNGRPGELIGELTVSYRRFSLIGNVENYNSTLLGRETAYLRAEYYGLLGLGDKTSLAGSTTFDFKKQRILQVGESVALGGNGDRFSLLGTFAYSRPDLQTLDLRTLSLIGDAEYTRPLVRTVSTNVGGALGFEWSEQRTRVYGDGISVPLNRDRIATIYARLDGEKRVLRADGSQKLDVSGTLELRKGLDILGATKSGVVDEGYTPTHFEGSATATVLRGQLSGTIGLGPIFELSTTLRGQWADRQLLNYDAFAIGNLTIGRGYDPGANTGDRAIAGAHEIRLNAPLGHVAHGQIYGFYDWVQLWNLDPTSTERNRWLASVGGGARLTLWNSMRLDVTYAHPLDPPLLTGVNIQRSPDRLMFSLTSQIVPFGPQR